ncbi:hypothetical protein I7G86_19470 [Sinorhizobium meliloti]|uniref:hypothetical protein n=1 Tax=Rhizobium meliloti TaxID=382 RepID=UPI000FD35BF0|nr:hypothetical protein [Sinorhizobium meliloti]MDE3763928.1 hypothetical protein [Sinorhizobium meliloti]MDE3776290.1 hypothetical protein [Sinorhizobium meliloti]MDE3792806.1 hypothetical protein [Sinorhizobium meliloti]MDE3805040.1 hypothetical protein [Sinorhizobium meliloti]MDE4563275.1 hypothetical protein [Sinorhizobium meliloti SM11]
MDRRIVLYVLGSALVFPRHVLGADMPRRLFPCVQARDHPDDNRYVNLIDTCGKEVLQVDIQWRTESGINLDRLPYRITRDFGPYRMIRRRGGQGSNPIILSERPYTFGNFRDVTNYIDVVERGSFWGFMNRTTLPAFIEYDEEQVPNRWYREVFIIGPSRYRPVSTYPIRLVRAEEEPD